MLIAVVNQSTLVSRTDGYLMTIAVGQQVRTHVAPLYGRVPPSVRWFTDVASVPAGAYLISLFDNSDQAGALGWHTEGPDGQVYGKVFAKPVLDNGGSILTGHLTVTSVLSHEVIEAFVDPHTNLWADVDSTMAIAVEAGDPVESDSYTITIKFNDGSNKDFSVSNFVTAAWFDPQAPAGTKLDYLGNVSKPFTMTKGGYYVFENESGVQQKFGETFPEWKKETKLFPAARTARRISRSMAQPQTTAAATDSSPTADHV